MSFHVYIAHAGFKDSPVDREQWLAAARGRPELVPLGTPEAACFALASDSAQRLSLDPHGLVHTQNPTRELVVVMFELAEVLGAGVYSEKLKRYSSPQDWEARTRSHRAQHQRHRAQLQRARRRTQLLWAAGALGVLLVCWLLPG